MKANPATKIISVEDLWKFFNESATLLCIAGTDGYFKQCNPAFTTILGYTEDELLSRPFAEFVHPEDRDATGVAVKDLSKGTAVFSFKNRYCTKSGEYRWLCWTATSPNNDGMIYATAEDCTERIKKEEEIEKLSMVAKKTLNGITITDKERKIIWVNESFCNLTGYSLEEVIGKNPLEVLGGPLTDNHLNSYIKSRVENAEPFLKETINYKKNGEPFWMRVEAQPIFNDQGELIKWIAVQSNITQQKMAEEHMMTNERKYRSIFEHSPLSNFIYDPHSLQILEANKAAVNLYGYELGEFLDLTICDLRTDNDPSHIEEMLKIINQGNYHGSCNHKKKDGTIIIADVTASMIEYKNHQAVLLIIKDITEKTKLQEELERSKLDAEKQYLEATLYGQDLERTEIGRELHDNINQMLTTVKLYNEIALGDNNRAKEFIIKGTEILVKSINEIRSLSKTLVTSGDQDMELFESVNDLIHTIMKGREINIHFFANKKDEELPCKLKLMFYRIIQEQLNNIIKHASATNVSIELLQIDGAVTLSIRDDGRGFDTKTKKNGIGLRNIISRVEIFKGDVIIESSPGEGCLLQVTIPSEEIFKIAV